jgi:hypothetical protein
VIVHDHAETPSAITLKPASTIAEMRNTRLIRAAPKLPAIDPDLPFVQRESGHTRQRETFPTGGSSPPKA